MEIGALAEEHFSICKIWTTKTNEKLKILMY